MERDWEEEDQEEEDIQLLPRLQNMVWKDFLFF